MSLGGYRPTLFKQDIPVSERQAIRYIGIPVFLGLYCCHHMLIYREQLWYYDLDNDVWSANKNSFANLPHVDGKQVYCRRTVWGPLSMESMSPTPSPWCVEYRHQYTLIVSTENSLVWFTDHVFHAVFNILPEFGWICVNRLKMVCPNKR